eukprot:TRINITY_DN48602_c0_g1_i1.p2 TRINITY_DN48602_c0_g1~~TRINITY_DN48602_c0_g1_i1.p2  ORF type:complete len:146 (+),score=0.84 TRINITY_DN48602_c0_g1_i1:70-507(+)
MVVTQPYLYTFSSPSYIVLFGITRSSEPKTTGSTSPLDFPPKTSSTVPNQISGYTSSVVGKLLVQLPPGMYSLTQPSTKQASPTLTLILLRLPRYTSTASDVTVCSSFRSEGVYRQKPEDVTQVTTPQVVTLYPSSWERWVLPQI